RDECPGSSNRDDRIARIPAARRSFTPKGDRNRPAAERVDRIRGIPRGRRASPRRPGFRERSLSSGTGERGGRGALHATLAVVIELDPSLCGALAWSWLARIATPRFLAVRLGRKQEGAH